MENPDRWTRKRTKYKTGTKKPSYTHEPFIRTLISHRTDPVPHSGPIFSTLPGHFFPRHWSRIPLISSRKHDPVFLPLSVLNRKCNPVFFSHFLSCYVPFPSRPIDIRVFKGTLLIDITYNFYFHVLNPTAEFPTEFLPSSENVEMMIPNVNLIWEEDVDESLNRWVFRIVEKDFVAILESFLLIFSWWLSHRIPSFWKDFLGHDQLLKICLLKKSARHNFIIARQHSSNNYFSCQLVDSRP